MFKEGEVVEVFVFDEKLGGVFQIGFGFLGVFR